MQNETFTTMSPFRFWCNKVLPAVYDDSLSYYELLCKVVKYLNDTIEIVNLHSQAITELQETLQKFIDGDFDDMIEAKVEEWFQENEPEIIQAISDLNIALGELDQSTDARLDALEQNEPYVYIPNNLVDADSNAELAIATLEGRAHLRITSNTSGNTLDNASLDGMTLAEIFDDSNIIELSSNGASWDSGTAVFENATISLSNGIPTMDFDTLNTGDEATVTFPSRTFLKDHVYVLMGQYRTTTYNRGFYGVRSINRLMFEPFMTDNYVNFLYVIKEPDNQNDALKSNLGRELILGVFYDNKALTQPYIHTKVRNLVLLDLTETFTNVPTMTSLKKAFDEYCSVKSATQSQQYYLELEPYSLYTSYDRNNFIRMMRYRAYSLDMQDSHFWTPHGLPENANISNPTNVNYGTVKDLARMGMAAMSNNVLQTIMCSKNKPMVIYGNRTLVQSKFRTHDTSDYPFSIMVNENLETLHAGGVGLLYDILCYKGGSLGTSANQMPWRYEEDTVGVFRSYVGCTEFSNDKTMLYAIHGGDASMVQQDMVFAIEQYMLSMVNTNDGVPLTAEQEAALATAQPLFGQLMDLCDENYDQPLSWGAIVLPSNFALYNSLPNDQLFTDYITKPVHPSHFVNDAKLYPFASTTKLLTCLLVVESGIDLTKNYIVVDSDITAGSGTILYTGMKINCRDLMYCALWQSDNDACNMLARIVGHEWVETYKGDCYAL